MGGGRFSEIENSEFKSLKVSVGITEVEATTSLLTDTRQQLIIYNASNRTVYSGPTGVTTSGANEGIPVEPGETTSLNFGPNLQVYLIASTGTNDVIVWETA